jgi:hypothetical protein
MLPSTNEEISKGAMYKFPASKMTNSYFMKPLQQGLGCNDVICGRHKDSGTNIGNRRFRVLVAILTQKYIHAPTRAHKSMVIREVVEKINGCGGKFVHQCKGKCASGTTIWEELSDKQTYDKVGHAFRDMSVSMQEKSDIKNLLSPNQATSSTTKYFGSDDADATRNSNKTSIPSMSIQESQAVVEQEQEDKVEEMNNNECGDGDSDDCWSLNVTDEDLEQCIRLSEAISSSTSNLDNNVHSNEHPQDDYSIVQRQWRRDSIRSFPCLVL